MSTTIDNKVVEMEFDNSKFDSNVKSSISALDKLKSALNFKGASDSLDELEKATDKVNFSSMDSALDKLNSKFSALEVIGVGALMKIGDQAVSAAEGLLKTFTGIENINTGWSMFGEKTKNVKTLIAQGYDVDEVEAQLEELAWYTDETSYNFTDMVSNITKFTAAGQGLTESVTAMEGIANWAALSGQNATTASRAMYQLSQAVSSGAMRLADYKSIINANMDTQEFRQTCLDTAVAMETLTETSDGLYKTLNGHTFDINGFTSYLTDDLWLTSDVMMSVFEQYAGSVDQIYEYAENAYEDGSISASQAIEELGDEIDDFGKKAFLAAQEARTWEDVVNSVTTGVASKWSESFQIILGDAEEVTTLWTKMSNQLYDIFIQPGNERNEMLEMAFGERGSSWSDLISIIGDTGYEATELQDKLKEVAKEWGMDVDYMVEQSGSFENSLKDYGWLTNDLLGTALNELQYGTKELTDDQKEQLGSLVDYCYESESIIQQTISNLTNTEESGHELLTDILVNTTDAILSVSDTVRGAWSDIFPSEEFADKIYNALNAIKDFTEGLILTQEQSDELSRALKGVFAIFRLIGNTISGSLQIVLDGLNDIFVDLNLNVGDFAANLGDSLVAVADAAEQNNVFLNVLQKLVDAIVKIVKKIKEWGKAVLELDSVQKIKDILVELFDSAIDSLPTIVEKVDELVTKFLELPIVTDTISNLGTVASNVFTSLGNYFGNVSSSLGAFKDSVSGLDVSNLDDIVSIFGSTVLSALFNLKSFSSVKTDVQTAASDISDTLTTASEDVETLGTTTEKTTNIVSAAISSLGTVVSNFASNASSSITNGFTSITRAAKRSGTLQTFLTLLASGGMMYVAQKGTASILGVAKALASPIQSFASMEASATGALEAIKKYFKTLTTTAKGFTVQGVANAILKVAISVGILAASLFVLANYTEGNKLNNAAAILGGFFVALIGIVAAIILLAKQMDTETFAKAAGLLEGVATAMLLMSASIFILVAAFEKMSNLEVIDPAVLVELAIALFFIAAVAFALSKVAISAKEGFGSVLIVFAFIIALNSIINSLIKLSDANIDNDKMGKLTDVVLALGGLVVGVVYVSKFAEHGKEAALLLISFAITLRLLVSTLEKLASMPLPELANGLGKLVIVLGALYGAYLIIKTLGGVADAKSMLGLVAIAGAMILLCGAIFLLSKMDFWAMAKGIAGVTALAIALGVCIRIIGDAGTNALKVSVAALAISAAIVILVGAIYLLSIIDTAKVFSSIAAISILMIAMGTMIRIMGNGLEANSAISILAMVSVIAALVAAIGFITVLDPDKVANAVGVMTALMAVVTVAYAIMAYTADANKTSTAGILAIAAVIIALAAAVYILAQIPVAQSIVAATELAVMILAMAVFCKVLTGLTPTLGQAAIAAVLLLAVLALMVGAIWAINEFVKEDSLTKIGVFALFVASAAAMMAALSLIAPLGTTAALGAAAIIGVISALILGVASLETLIEFINQFGWDIWDKISNFFTGLGNAIGSFIAAIGEKVAGKMGTMGENIQKFSDGLSSLTSIKDVANDEDTMDALDNIIDLFSSLSKINSYADKTFDVDAIMDSVIAFVGKWNDFKDALSGFEDGDLDKINKASEIAANLADFTESLPRTGGDFEMLLGKKDIEEFGEKVKAFIQAMSLSAVILRNSTWDDALSKKFEAVATIGTSFNELATSLNNTGGIVQAILGIGDLGTFGDQCSNFIDAIGDCANTMRDNNYTWTEDDVTNFTNMANAVSPIANVWQAIVDNESKWKALLGTQVDFTTVGQQFGSFLTSIAGITDVGIDAEKMSSYGAAINAVLGPFIRAANTTYGLSGMVSNVASLGVQIAKFVESANGVDTTYMDALATEIIKVIHAFDDLTQDKLDKINQLNDALQNVINSSVESFINGFGTETFQEEVSSAVSALYDKFVQFVCADDMIPLWSELGTNIAKMIAEGLVENSSEKENPFVTACKDLVTMFADVFTNKDNGTGGVGSENIALDAMDTFAKDCSDQLKSEDNINLFNVAGNNWIQGIINGMNAGAQALYDTATVIATTTYNIFHDSWSLGSPSKLAYKYGAWWDIGLANGLTDYAYSIEAASNKAASTTVSSMQTTIGKIADAIDGSIDSNPTITPIMDLSNVQAGASAINSMFGTTSTKLANKNGYDFNESRSTTIGNSEIQNGLEKTGNTFQFTQNNYSPKALSRLEIYRQTRNQFAQMKGLVE